jgi:hypothetical protein
MDNFDKQSASLLNVCHGQLLSCIYGQLYISHDNECIKYTIVMAMIFRVMVVLTICELHRGGKFKLL